MSTNRKANRVLRIGAASRNQWLFAFGLRRRLGDRFFIDARFGGAVFAGSGGMMTGSSSSVGLFQRCLFRLDGFAFFRLNRLRLVDRLSNGGIDGFRRDFGSELFDWRRLVRY